MENKKIKWGPLGGEKENTFTSKCGRFEIFVDGKKFLCIADGAAIEVFKDLKEAIDACQSYLDTHDY